MKETESMTTCAYQNNKRFKFDETIDAFSHFRPLVKQKKIANGVSGKSDDVDEQHRTS